MYLGRQTIYLTLAWEACVFTWHERPVYSGGQVQSSSHVAWSCPVFCGTAVSRLSPRSDAEAICVWYVARIRMASTLASAAMESLPRQSVGVI